MSVENIFMGDQFYQPVTRSYAIRNTLNCTSDIFNPRIAITSPCGPDFKIECHTSLRIEDNRRRSITQFNEFKPKDDTIHLIQPPHAMMGFLQEWADKYRMKAHLVRGWNG